MPAAKAALCLCLALLPAIYECAYPLVVAAFILTAPLIVSILAVAGVVAVAFDILFFMRSRPGRLTSGLLRGPRIDDPPPGGLYYRFFWHRPVRRRCESWVCGGSRQGL